MSTAVSLEPSAKFDASELIKLLTGQRDLYGRLVGLSARQRSLITGDTPEQLLEVLGQRQQVLDELATMTERLRPYQQQWPALRRRMTSAQGEEMDRLTGEMQSMLSAIMAQDKADAELLAARKSSVAAGVGELKQGRQAGRAYEVAGTNSGTGADWTDA